MTYRKRSQFKKPVALALMLCWILFLHPSCFLFSDPDQITPAVDTGTGTDTDSDADTDTDTDSDTDTDTDTDIDTDSDSDTDTDTYTDTVTDTDTDTDTNTDTDTGSGSDTDTSCTPKDCFPPEYCNETSGECEPCTINNHCGEKCMPCEGTTPTCDDPDGTAANATCICETKPTPNGTCGSGSHCVSGACEECNTNDFCGDTCAVCTETATPICDTTAGTCVECTENTHCQDGEKPFDSPLGICTPDQTCTCWAESGRWDCAVVSQCPSNYYCAKDVDGPGAFDHFICLSSCVSGFGPDKGLTCEERATAESGNQLVWVPMTTCFAYSKFGDACKLNDDCRISAALGDGSCQTFGADDLCTYSCLDGDLNDAWCPTTECRSSGDYCVP